MQAKFFLSFALAAAVGGTALAEPTLKISLGIRETNTTAGIGANGGTSGGIEWVNLDGQTLTLDGTWQQFSFRPAVDTLTAFAGASANGLLDGAAGTIEHVRLLSDGFAGPISVWFDDVSDTVDPAGPPPPVTTPIAGSFEGFADGTEVMFQEPSFSGSTSANVLPGSVSGIDNAVAHTGAAAYRSDFQFVDNATTRWIRLTTFNTPNIPNPAISFDPTSVVTLWMRGIPEPSTLSLLVLAGALVARRRR